MLNFEDLKHFRSYISPKVTQTDMASRWPCDKTYISKLENGRLPLTQTVADHFIEVVKEIRAEKRAKTYVKPLYSKDKKSKHDYYMRKKKAFWSSPEGQALKKERKKEKARKKKERDLDEHRRAVLKSYKDHDKEIRMKYRKKKEEEKQVELN